MENYLETLKQTAESAEVVNERKYSELKEEETRKDNEMIAEITGSLKTKLMQEAQKGNRKFTVVEASIHGNYMKRDSGAFYDYGKCWNTYEVQHGTWSDFYTARNDKKTIERVIAISKGVFKAVYEYCQKEGLNPSVRYFDDGVGQTWGYGIYINW
jgi:hypothetical protein